MWHALDHRGKAWEMLSALEEANGTHLHWWGLRGHHAEISLLAVSATGRYAHICFAAPYYIDCYRELSEVRFQVLRDENRNALLPRLGAVGERFLQFAASYFSASMKEEVIRNAVFIEAQPQPAIISAYGVAIDWVTAPFDWDIQQIKEDARACQYLKRKGKEAFDDLFK